MLQSKKNLRLLTINIEKATSASKKLTSVQGGLLVQEEDTLSLDESTISIPTKREPSEQEWKDLKLAWKVVKHVKSNAIVLAKDDMTIGVGAGQMNRVGSAKIAITQAGEKAQGSALASDAFFPMPDTLEEAAKEELQQSFNQADQSVMKILLKWQILMGLLWCSLAYVISNTNRGCLKSPVKITFACRRCIASAVLM